MLFAACLSLPLIGLTGYGLYDRARDEFVAAEAIARRLSESNADRVAEYVQNLRVTVEAIARRPLVKAMDAARCDPRLDDLVDLYPRASNFGVANLEGVIICSSRPLPPGRVVRIVDEELQREMLANPRFLMSKPIVSRVTGRWIVGAVQPVTGDGGALAGTVAVVTDLSQWRPFPPPDALPAGAVITVVTSDGTIIARSADAEKWISRKIWDERLLQRILEAKEGVVHARGVDGSDRIFGISAVSGLPWYALAGLPAESVFAPARERMAWTTAFLVLVVGAVGLLSWGFIARLSALERGLHERTTQLEAANKELDGFSYSVSHDLRAPLRAVDGYTRMLEEDYGAGLGEEGRRLLGVVRSSSRKMAELIDDLLAFSRLGRQEPAKRPFNMTALAREAIGEVGHGALEAVALSALPEVDADRALLKQVWLNLVANAVKFSAKSAPPRIEIGGRQNGADMVFWVRDNGVGFDMRYADRLFGVFQRLHREDEFPGTGVGLAIVQRVIARHGGRVWAEGKAGEGACFYFSLPRGEAHA